MVKTRSMIKSEWSLPDEIISEIFVRLPVKSLCRFKCVSKSILSMIEHDSSFVEKARLKPPFIWQFEHGDDICVYSFDAEGLTTHVKTFKCPDKFRYVNDCNGLACYYSANRIYRLCNLTTKECMDLPGMCKYFEFCFDPLSKKYKVLSWWVYRGGICEFEILTLGDLSWRPVMNTLEIKIMPKSETTVNERLFWVYRYEQQVVSFNVANEEFSVIEFPELTKKTIECAVLEFEGSLVLVEQPIGEVPTFNLWMLKDICRSNRWIKMKNITVPFEGSSLCHGYNIFRHAWRMFLSQSGEIIVPVFNDEGRYLFVYSFLNGQFKMMKITVPASLDFIPKKYVENHVGLEELVFHQ